MLFCLSPKLRKNHINRIDVVDRVGRLLLLLYTELATTKQVAEFYGISQEVIRDNIRRYKEELEANWLVFMPYREVIAVIGDIGTELRSEIISLLGINKRGNNVFSKRAILNIGMLLRDSREISKGVNLTPFRTTPEK